MVPMIKAWIDVSITNNVYSVQPNAYVFVPTGVTGVGFGTITEDGEVFAGCAFDENVMQYCNLDGIVYIGQERAWWYYTKGDAALLEVFGHETGHRFQHLAEIPAAENDNAQVYRENQADCVAGVWMDYLSEHQSLYQDDVLDFATGIIAIGSPIEGEQRTHGTADQRMRAFYLGYNNPVPPERADVLQRLHLQLAVARPGRTNQLEPKGQIMYKRLIALALAGAGVLSVSQHASAHDEAPDPPDLAEALETCIEITGYERTSEDFLRDGGASIVFDEVDVEGPSSELIDCTVGQLMPTWVAYLLSSGAEADGDQYYEYNGMALFVALSGDDDEESVTLIIADLTAPPTLMAEDFPLQEGSAEEAETSEDESDATALDPTPTAAEETATTTG